jgi:hypothetical protein
MKPLGSLYSSLNPRNDADLDKYEPLTSIDLNPVENLAHMRDAGDIRERRDA